ncbi:MAG: DUF4276 family protein [Candidatus Accumulibacter phosphatis]|jgi:hypothetical protein|uniref:DUF4276 family protein n=1 Tax=Candidatus Accumulibacter contiguus TaxID=2954381 RepID=A0ABX1TGE7_9PROT|nr:DUF4276 family protein [Candidatus Accumulibacter contiguus]NMQ07541.1 DUF4276 family protein [Candidatus Accumulibacter contiguus]
MIWFEVLVEGASDVPAVREVLTRHFGLLENLHFRIHRHKGRGILPDDLLGQPDPKQQTLLHQLPAKLKGFSHLGDQACVVVLIDVDRDPCRELLGQLNSMLARLPKRPPRVLFRLAIEETESWFIADVDAVAAAYPKVRAQKLQKLRRIVADEIVGAWEELAVALDIKDSEVTGADKYAWAERISPYLNLTEPHSPSLRKFVDGIHREVLKHPAGSR